jgi:predicted nucleic acid-binding protein
MSPVTSPQRSAATTFPIRGLDDDVVRRLDSAARSRGMSRNADLVEVLTTHARQVLHRSVPVPDVIVAAVAVAVAVAVAEGLTVLHDDRDFGRIAEVYGGPEHERLRR